MAAQRDGRNILYLVMESEDKKQLYEVVAHIPYENMASFARRAIRREIERYYNDPQAYITKNYNKE